MEKEKAEVLEKQVLPLLIEGLDLMDSKKYREAYARINDAVVLLAADVIGEVDIVDITAQVLRGLEQAEKKGEVNKKWPINAGNHFSNI